jgi:hypothetical protein
MCGTCSGVGPVCNALVIYYCPNVFMDAKYHDITVRVCGELPPGWFTFQTVFVRFVLCERDSIDAPKLYLGHFFV